MAKQRSRCSEKKGGDQKTAQMVRMMFFPSDVKNPYFTRELPVRLGLVIFDNYSEHVTQAVSYTHLTLPTIYSV